jgi:hypothetical protein
MNHVSIPAAPGKVRERKAYTEKEWCALYGFSKTKFYDMRTRKIAPRVNQIGRQNYIDIKEAERWHNEYFLTKVAAPPYQKHKPSDLPDRVKRMLEEALAMEAEKASAPKRRASK